MNLSEGQDLLDDSLLHKTHSSLGLHSTAFLLFSSRFPGFPMSFLFFAVNSLCFVYSSNDDIPLSVLSGPLLILYTSVLQVVVDLIFYLLSSALHLAILPD